VNLERFRRERHADWDELEALVRAARERAERLGPDRARRLAALYRSAVADLARARRKWPHDPSVGRLETLVSSAHQLLYAGVLRRTSLRFFFVRGYWRTVAERPVPLLVAALLLFGPGFVAGAWALSDPGAASGLVPAAYRSVGSPRGDLGLPVEEQAALSSLILTNNIRVSFFAFAGGIAAGLVTAALVAYNGVLLGVVSGLAIGAGNARPFFELVVAHGVLELSCIVVAAAAGLRLGWALVEPARLPRARAVVEEARKAAAMALGTAPWLVLAGLVEGFLTPAGFGLGAALAVGVGLGAVYWSLVLSLSRS
jgi:uncharacterized membrane protein SpoIIM required for sporulation